jgi:ketosteroid isomerase-like protein
MYVFDDLALQLGGYEFTATPLGGTPVRDRGSFTIVWRRQPAGAWRYSRGIFNSSLPPTGTIDRKGQ